MFADDVKVSKGMVKYACGIPKESIVDVGGILTCPEAKIESATQKDVSIEYQVLHVAAVWLWCGQLRHNRYNCQPLACNAKLGTCLLFGVSTFSHVFRHADNLHLALADKSCVLQAEV
jgi:hypothetical protein